jgi:prephenate dehydrogenase
MNEPIVDTIAIIGVGLIGGSLGMATKSRGLAKRVIGIGRDPRKLIRAQQLAAVDAVTTDLIGGASQADLIFVCPPVLAVVPTIQAIAAHLKPGTIVTDVGSTKTEITRGAEAIVPDACYFVGGHPMTGSEESGVEAAVPYLFLDATYVITPTENTDVRALGTLVNFAEGLGSQTILMSPEQHDRSAAIISHIPHVLAAAILRLAAEEQDTNGKAFELAAGSFRDLTRVSQSPPELWRDICISGKDAISSELKHFQQILAEIITQIEAGDSEALEKLFTDAKTVRETRVRDKKSDR